MSREPLTIGELAERTGVATSALRYYEEIGLMPPAKRSSGQRRYGQSAVQHVGVLLFLRDVGFSLAEMKELLASRARSPARWRELAHRKIDELDERIASAQAARVVLEHSLRCPKDDVLECPNFWRIVEGRLAGRTLEEAHASE